MPERLDRGFYARGAEAVARDLLGNVLCHRHAPDAPVQQARIVETEAYVGAHDLACHAAKGRTPRTEVMFEGPGHAYVYFVYGMHDMLNVVTAPPGDPQAVLLRALEPLRSVQGRTDGPGRLTKALRITVADHNRMDLCGNHLWIESGQPPERIGVGPRVGIDYAGEWADAPLRFWDEESPSVSHHATSRPRR